MTSATSLSKGGTTNSRKKVRANGMEPKSRNGRRRPQRECSRSLMLPMSGSLTASHRRPTSHTPPASPALRPTTLVRKTNQKTLRAVAAAEVPQSPRPKTNLTVFVSGVWLNSTPAIDRHSRAVDIPGQVGGQEEDDVGH